CHARKGNGACPVSAALQGEAGRAR
ncbi:MerR family transcriptional regulator, partial [Pseudomonas aeruginosa]|nr:MerR family transcriptional regulator [Pseudomonas aeruginosa]